MKWWGRRLKVVFLPPWLSISGLYSSLPPVPTQHPPAHWQTHSFTHSFISPHSVRERAKLQDTRRPSVGEGEEDGSAELCWWWWIPRLQDLLSRQKGLGIWSPASSALPGPSHVCFPRAGLGEREVLLDAAGSMAQETLEWFSVRHERVCSWRFWGGGREGGRQGSLLFTSGGAPGCTFPKAMPKRESVLIRTPSDLTK